MPDKKKKSDIDEFWRQVRIGRLNECWPWLGKTMNNRDYGVFKNRLAHRFAYEVTSLTPIKLDLCVCHNCDNPTCVNPFHLWQGTQAENLKDMWQKGRGVTNGGRRGEECNKAKLTQQQVIEIRHSPESSRSLGRRYGVSKTAILYIKQRKNWAHV